MDFILLKLLKILFYQKPLKKNLVTAWFIPCCMYMYIHAYSDFFYILQTNVYATFLFLCVCVCHQHHVHSIQIFTCIVEITFLLSYNIVHSRHNKFSKFKYTLSQKSRLYMYIFLHVYTLYCIVHAFDMVILYKRKKKWMTGPNVN